MNSLKKIHVMRLNFFIGHALDEVRQAMTMRDFVVGEVIGDPVETPSEVTAELEAARQALMRAKVKLAGQPATPPAPATTA